MRSSYWTAFWGVSDHAPISFCPLYPHSSPGSRLTLLTADSAIRSSAYFLNAAAGSSWVWAIVTVACMPRGPSSRLPTSPLPPDIDQPSGTPIVIRGARGSSTPAVILTAGLIVRVQVAVLGGTGARDVGRTPNVDGSASCVGPVIVDGGDDAIPPGPASPATGTPSLVLTQADTNTAARQSRMNVVHRISFINPSRTPAQVPFPASHTVRRKDP